MINNVLTTDGFYFCTDFDLTHTLQRLANTSPDFQEMSLLERVKCLKKNLDKMPLQKLISYSCTKMLQTSHKVLCPVKCFVLSLFYGYLIMSCTLCDTVLHYLKTQSFYFITWCHIHHPASYNTPQSTIQDSACS